MLYPKSSRYDTPALRAMMMGPNPVKLLEELMAGIALAPEAHVCDLGCGRGLGSVFLAREYGLRVTAADWWSEPEDNQAFFDAQGLSDRITAVKADANALPFARKTFEAVIAVDSYNYYGRSEGFLDEKILPFVRPGGLVAFAVPALPQGCHSHLPASLLASWTPVQLDYLQSREYWCELLSHSTDAEVVLVKRMHSHEEVWKDWLALENPYAVNDRKAVRAGALDYLHFVAAVVRKRQD